MCSIRYISIVKPYTLRSPKIGQLPRNILFLLREPLPWTFFKRFDFSIPAFVMAISMFLQRRRRLYCQSFTEAVFLLISVLVWGAEWLGNCAGLFVRCVAHYMIRWEEAMLEAAFHATYLYFSLSWVNRRKLGSTHVTPNATTRTPAPPKR